MSIPSKVSTHRLRRWLTGVSGRPLAVLVLVLVVATRLFAELLPQSRFPLPPWLSTTATTLDAPLEGARNALFDGYQGWWPRVPRTQPVTIVAIDEKSLRELGQWPWPRDRMARLIRTIGKQRPAAVGLDIYMPEVDQNSPDQLARRLPDSLAGLRAALQALPSNDEILAQALRQVPSVLGVAGFDFKTYTTTAGVRSVPLMVAGGEPGRFVRRFRYALASLPELQSASSGQAILSVDAGSGGVRRVPLLAAVGEQLVPGMAMEMLRVGTGSPAVSVTAGAHGIERVGVADLAVPTLPNGQIYLHFARMSSGLSRYVSAVDVLQGGVDPTFFRNKLVLIGLTGLGLNDMRSTALGELVPGVEIQAQTIEALFDGALLSRPWWLAWLEAALSALLCSALIWLLPRSDNHLARRLKVRPQRALALTAMAVLAMLALGAVLFRYAAVLFDAAFLTIVFALVMAILLVSDMISSLADAQGKLARLVENGIALGQEQQRASLLRMTLEGAREIARCEAAAVFLRTGQQTLAGALATEPGILPATALPLDDAASPGRPTVAGHVLVTGRSLFVDDAARDRRFRTGADEPATRRWTSTLAVPMTLHGDEVIGVIQLFDATDPDSERIIPFHPRLLGFIEALAAQAAVAIRNQDLVEAQKNLMDSMIRVIAGAIDFKSPYTGGHCARVPELAILLAEAACAVDEGPLAPFRFGSDDEWREFRIGAWLHDCGKVTTPEYVVDKATKLETIYNRIHEIRTRFEVLLRDARIACLEAIHERGENPVDAQARFEAEKAALVDDFAFVAECNLGGEFMARERIERLQQIADRRWLRHFDDRLGISSDEQGRYRDHGFDAVTPLPAEERLLADKPNHRVMRPASQSPDPRYGFKLDVPEDLYNFGELHNLTVGRGTLTEEERFKINEHIMQTIVMLEQMPLPPNLARVPEYAGTHHETLTGSGYPRRLTEAELSIPARIMAIADIFEALTASDRPYKQAKSLSEAIRILSFFRNDRHIDPDLFELFLRSGVYRTYAERFLSPEQIDEVDIEQYVG